MLTLEAVELRQGAFQLAADWSVGTGLTAVIGPSGGGKSTLLGAIAGFVVLERGAVRWNGRDLSSDGPGDRPVSVLFQDNNLFPHLTVRQNVGLALRPDLKLSAADREAVDAVLVSVGLGGMGGRKPAALSGGQQSRAGLARVLLSDRPVVLLDEPFSALGPGLRQEMLDLVVERLSDRVVLLVTHDPQDARRVASQVVLVADGVAAGPVETEALFAAPPEALRGYLGT